MPGSLPLIGDFHGSGGVNGDHALFRQRFTFAHEIGHLVLRRDQFSRFIERSAGLLTAAFQDGNSTSSEHRPDLRSPIAGGIERLLSNQRTGIHWPRSATVAALRSQPRKP